MGRRPNLKSEAFSISTILCVEIIANLCLKPLKKVLHYSGARPSGGGCTHLHESTLGTDKSYQVDSFSCRVHPGVRIHFMQSSTVSEHALQSICTQVTGACWGSSSLTALGPRSAPDLPDPARLASLAPSSCGWPWAWAPCLSLSAPPALAATLC